MGIRRQRHRRFCHEVMKRDVEILRPDDTVEFAARLMRDVNIGFLPVVDRVNILGALTDRDIVVRVIADGKPPAAIRVSEAMTNDVVFCHPDDELHVAEQRMAEARTSRIMCIDGSRLVGIISLSDIAIHDTPAHAAETMRAVSAREAHR
jgi:CBS domain-containing protein